jgi:hypothetical protein
MSLKRCCCFVVTCKTLVYRSECGTCVDYALGREGKTFFLSGACQTSFTSTQNCFCVSNPAEEDESGAWYLLAENEE